MATSSHYLCFDNHHEIYSSCQEICSEWENLAAQLSVKRSSVKTIKADGKDSADCLRMLFDAWLKRSTPQQPLPSWRNLCDALSHIDPSLSERISTQHQCGCSICTERLGSVAVGIVSPLYNEIYLRLQNPQRVANYMYQEDAITLDHLEKIQDSTGNIKEVLFTTLESSVSLNHYHLKIFATALLNEEDTHSVGKMLKSKYKENFSPLAKSKEFIVDVQYKREFEKMRAALGDLCDTTISLLHQKEVAVSELKCRLWRSFPELKEDLQKCTSLEEVVDDIIRPQVSLIQIDYLETIFDKFHLATKFVKEYSQAVEAFCEKMRVEHAYGQSLMEFDHHIPKMETITFVLDWEVKNEYCLKDVQGLFKKVVRKYSSHVKVVVMFPGNSVVIECRIPAHLHLLFSEMIHDREEILNKEKVISVSAGGCTIFKRTVTVEQRDEERDEIGGVVDIDSASVHSSDASVLPSSGIDPGDVPLSIDDDVSYAETILIYERRLRDMRRNGKKLEETVMIKDSMIKQMSAEFELKNRKEKKLEETVMMKDSMIKQMSAELDELKNGKGKEEFPSQRKIERMSTSSHPLCIDNHSIVYFACELIQAKWEDLATHLFVARPSVQAIRKEDGKDCADCLRKLLDEWLKRSSPEQPLPSWRGLCYALSHLDQSLSESISAQHQCGCSICTGCDGEVPIGLVSPLYNEIYQKLKNPVGVADYMYSERVFSLHQLKKIKDSPGNEKEVLFTSLESAVSFNQYNLRVFGKALMKEEATHSLGKSVLGNCIKEEFPSQSKIKEIFVEMKYKKEFDSMRSTLGQLCASAVTLLSQKKIDVARLKNHLRFSFPELESDLKECSSLDEVVRNVIRPRVSLVQIDYLEAVFNLFSLSRIPIQEYNQKVNKLYESVRVVYGQLLIKEFDSSTSELESIKFVIDWKVNEHWLKDVRDLFKKIVRGYSSQVKVIVISEGN